jgi:cobalt-precorrin-5B (C1)-methyltransferase
MKTNLRSGYTTGACASAAAKAAAELILTGTKKNRVSIPFPDGSRVGFNLAWSHIKNGVASAAVQKDAGDDPDITNGALIVAEARIVNNNDIKDDLPLRVIGGTGVGLVTKPGLAVAVGQPAINPVPMQMIRQAVAEIVSQHHLADNSAFEVTIIVPEGAALAEKTLNKRLGIIGGISILGTTGIVRPVSADAWTATISASMDVARAAGIKEIVLSTGRTSERCLEALLEPPEESLVMMGDYLDFSLQEVKKYSFERIHMAAMWAKLLKGAMKIPHTHVRHGILELEDVYRFLATHGVDKDIVKSLKGSNTARETLTRLIDMDASEVFVTVCQLAQEHYEKMAGIPVTIYLVNGPGDLLYTHH